MGGCPALQTGATPGIFFAKLFPTARTASHWMRLCFLAWSGIGDGEEGKFMGKEGDNDSQQQIFLFMGNLWKIYGKFMGNLWEIYGKFMRKEGDNDSQQTPIHGYFQIEYKQVL